MIKHSTSATKEQSPLGPVHLLTIPQVAEILAVSQATVFRLIKYDGLPVTRMGHTTRIPKNRLHTWIEDHTA